MSYASLISELRVLVGDSPRKFHVDFTGDASTTVFQLPVDTFPVLDQTGTYIVRLAGVEQDEGDDYTLDKETGILVMAIAPGSSVSLTVDGSAVYVLDAVYLTFINDTIRSLGDDFWKEVTDDSSLTTTANMLSLSAPSGYMAIYNIWYRESTTDDWLTVASFTNWRYAPDENKLYFGDREAFPITGKALKIRGLKRYTLGDEVADTVDVQDRYLTLLKYGGAAWYWKHRYKSVVELTTKMTQENTRTPLQEIIMLSDRMQREFEAERARLKPAKPARTIPIVHQGSVQV